MEQFPKILSMGDVIRILGVSRSRIEEFIRKGQLRCQDTTAGKVFLESDVMAFKADRQKRAKKDPRIKRGR
ncbi:hypothetical protein A3D88_03745 [Candidatus Peribacteria bacterium RIFCSPHIGHO2_02_FULL_52_16]|nr:MAG: hypothetical protein A2706_04560 [Candidatus Peribacteria bacterium RIFCSPHIGHO2_01_FULL_51_35]OGJ61794.1 MAG: hypothetical protein A3D88_03745 [Candidatus Peribacteria bacterium RIFCSPHIGHO2_02_FULL_52_16]